MTATLEATPPTLTPSLAPPRSLAEKEGPDLCWSPSGRFGIKGAGPAILEGSGAGLGRVRLVLSFEFPHPTAFDPDPIDQQAHFEAVASPLLNGDEMRRAGALGREVVKLEMALAKAEQHLATVAMKRQAILKEVPEDVAQALGAQAREHRVAEEAVKQAKAPLDEVRSKHQEALSALAIKVRQAEAEALRFVRLEAQKALETRLAELATAWANGLSDVAALCKARDPKVSLKRLAAELLDQAAGMAALRDEAEQAKVVAP